MTASLRRRPSSPAAAPPLEDENLLSEILLRLPPLPSSLPRASAVSKRWRGLASDPRFIRRFRAHHRRSPPLLGCFVQKLGSTHFQPVLEAPDHVPPGRFSLQQDRDGLLPLGCRHGLVLLLDPKRKHALVWDPVTGDKDRIALPPGLDVEDGDLETNGAVIRAAGDVHFQVVVLVPASDDEPHTGMLGCVYSSETGLWGNVISTPLSPWIFLSNMPAVLVGGSLYWTLSGEFSGILEFDLERQSLDVIRLPMDLEFEEEHVLTVMRAEGGGLRFLFVSEEDLSAQLWKRKTDCDGVASWELGRTIELDKLLSLNSEDERMFLRILGFAECHNVVFLWTRLGLFMVELESLQFKKVSEPHDRLVCCIPFESVYAAGGPSTQLINWEVNL